MDTSGSGEDTRSVANGAVVGSSETTPLLRSAPPTQWRAVSTETERTLIGADRFGTKQTSDRSARVRLQPYLNKAIAQQKYQYRLGKFIKYGINFILLLQVSVGAAITVVTVLDQTEQTRLTIAGLGSLGTMTAAILARAKLKGTNQPELAETHSRDLERLIGQCELFIGDVGSATGPEIDAQASVMEFVRQFDAIEDKAVQASRGRETQTAAAPPV